MKWLALLFLCSCGPAGYSSINVYSVTVEIKSTCWLDSRLPIYQQTWTVGEEDGLYILTMRYDGEDNGEIAQSKDGAVFEVRDETCYYQPIWTARIEHDGIEISGSINEIEIDEFCNPTICTTRSTFTGI